MLGQNPSPQFLPAPRPQRGFKRLNRLPALVFGLAALAVVAVLAYTFWQRAEYQNLAQLSEATPQPAPAGSLIAGPDVKPAAYVAPKHAEIAPNHVAPATTKREQKTEDDERTKFLKTRWQKYYQDLGQLDDSRYDRRLQSIRSGGGQIAVAMAGAPQGSAPSIPGADLPASGLPSLPGLPGFGLGIPGFGGLGLGAAPQIDVAGQIEKQHFVASGANPGAVIAVRTPAPGPYVVTRGTWIPIVLENGANSDLPGPMKGIVAENIYDHRGLLPDNCPLIPQGAEVTGSYDNMVSAGQSRLLIGFDHIVYPDASEVDLGRMQGTDQSGAAGAEDIVNRHFWEKFGNATLLAIAGSAAQLSQPLGAIGGSYNAQQVAAAQLGTQYAQLGQQYAQAGLAIPNTIEIRPGYRLNVFVNKPMVLPPYCRGSRGPQLPIIGIN